MKYLYFVLTSKGCCCYGETKVSLGGHSLEISVTFSHFTNKNGRRAKRQEWWWFFENGRSFMIWILSLDGDIRGNSGSVAALPPVLACL